MPRPRPCADGNGSGWPWRCINEKRQTSRRASGTRGCGDGSGPGGSRGAGEPDVSQRHRADSPAVVSGLSSARQHGPDVADELPGDPALGAVDEDKVEAPRDAAVAHRSKGRRAGVQERPVGSATTRSPRSPGGSTSGAPRGNPEDAPAPVEFQEFGAWTIDPDLIVSSPPHTVPAEAGDWWGDYIVPSGISTDRYIQAIQTKTGDLRVVHHALTYAVTDPDSPLNDSREDAFLNEYAVGKNAERVPGRHGAAVRGRLAGAVQLSLPLGRGGSDRPDRAGPGALSRGVRAGPHPLLATARAGGRARHPGRAGDAARRLREDVSARETHRVSAAHALPGHPAVSGADLPDPGRPR